MDLNLRTESIREDKILNLFVDNSSDRRVINGLKDSSPTIVVGSRGIGKSFLMKVAQVELLNELVNEGVFPVYITFRKASLVHAEDRNKFRNWMIAKILTRTRRALIQAGKLHRKDSFLGGGLREDDPLERIAKDYEESYRNPEQSIDTHELPDIDDITDLFEDLCVEFGFKRFCLLFDEAAHVFRPSYQRAFFTLFRALRCPYISCNAAVYPGVTHYGESFEKAHDATFINIERSITDKNYLATMWEMVNKQINKSDRKSIESKKNLFNTLAFCAGGNPRNLYKTLGAVDKWRTQLIERVIKKFYLQEIWADHTKLGDKFKGHQKAIDWGRDFLEREVIKRTKDKIERRLDEHGESTIYFWIHKDVDAFVKEALRLLCYSGIIKVDTESIRGSSSKLGQRYSIKFGCVLANFPNPVNESKRIFENLTSSLFTEYGHNNQVFNDLPEFSISHVEDVNDIESLNRLMSKRIDVLDLTNWQKDKIKALGVTTIQELLDKSRRDLKQIYYVGEIRARQIMNAVKSEMLEYLSG